MTSPQPVLEASNPNLGKAAVGVGSYNVPSVLCSYTISASFSSQHCSIFSSSYNWFSTITPPYVGAPSIQGTLLTPHSRCPVLIHRCTVQTKYKVLQRRTNSYVRFSPTKCNAKCNMQLVCDGESAMTVRTRLVINPPTSSYAKSQPLTCTKRKLSPQFLAYCVAASKASSETVSIWPGITTLWLVSTE